MLTAGQILHADDIPTAPDGYKMVPIHVGDRIVYVQVQKQDDPYKNVQSASSDKYRPDQINYSGANPLANKTFVSGDAPVNKSDSDLEDREKQSFVTKSYFDLDKPQANNPTSDLAAKASPLANPDASGSANSGLDKSYATSAYDTGQNKTTAYASTTSAYQDREAVLGTRKTEVFASTTLAPKQYLGPGAQNVPDGVAIKENVVLSRMSGVPDRPLTIDEVRNLINHETKPEADAPPKPESKPLNDPEYKPTPSPAPPLTEDDNNDPVPPPGTMAAPQPQPPENSEPLPTK